MPNKLLIILSDFYKNQSFNFEEQLNNKTENLKNLKPTNFSSLENQKKYMIYKAINKNYGLDYIFEIHEKISIYLKQKSFLKEKHYCFIVHLMLFLNIYYIYRFYFFNIIIFLK